MSSLKNAVLVVPCLRRGVKSWASFVVGWPKGVSDVGDISRPPMLLPLLPFLRCWSWDIDALLAAGLEVGAEATCPSCPVAFHVWKEALRRHHGKAGGTPEMDPLHTMTRFQPTAKAMESGMGLHSAAIALAVSEGLGDLCSRQGGCDLVWEELFEDLALFPDR